MGEKVCFALRGLDQRQQNGTQHLPDVDVLFRKTGEMLEVFERTLLTHVSGENGSLMVWHANEREVVRGLGTVLEVYGHTSGLVLLYNETSVLCSKFHQRGISDRVQPRSLCEIRPERPNGRLLQNCARSDEQ